MRDLHVHNEAASSVSEAWLNEAGAAGWELVSVLPSSVTQVTKDALFRDVKINAASGALYTAAIKVVMRRKVDHRP